MLVSDMAFSETLPKTPAFQSPFTVGDKTCVFKRVFSGYFLIKTPAENLWGICFYPLAQFENPTSLCILVRDILIFFLPIPCMEWPSFLTIITDWLIPEESSFCLIHFRLFVLKTKKKRTKFPSDSTVVPLEGAQRLKIVPISHHHPVLSQANGWKGCIFPLLNAVTNKDKYWYLYKV